MCANKSPFCRSLPPLLTICGESIVTKCCERVRADRDSRRSIFTLMSHRRLRGSVMLSDRETALSLWSR
jgi:hypothetical protein